MSILYFPLKVHFSSFVLSKNGKKKDNRYTSMSHKSRHTTHITYLLKLDE